jgi:hypothetical protein
MGLQINRFLIINSQTLTVKRYFLSIILLSLCLCSFAQHKLYISEHGDDRNPGTISKPLKTLHEALGKVSEANENKVIIYLRKGKYAPGKNYSNSSRFTSQSPVGNFQL